MRTSSPLEQRARKPLEKCKPNCGRLQSIRFSVEQRDCRRYNRKRLLYFNRRKIENKSLSPEPNLIRSISTSPVSVVCTVRRLSPNPYKHYENNGLSQVRVLEGRQRGQYMDIGMGFGVRQWGAKKRGGDVFPLGGGHRRHCQWLFVGQVRTQENALHLGGAANDIRTRPIFRRVVSLLFSPKDTSRHRLRLRDIRRPNPGHRVRGRQVADNRRHVQPFSFAHILHGDIGHRILDSGLQDLAANHWHSRHFPLLFMVSYYTQDEEEEVRFSRCFVSRIPMRISHTQILSQVRCARVPAVAALQGTRGRG